MRRQTCSLRSLKDEKPDSILGFSSDDLTDKAIVVIEEEIVFVACREVEGISASSSVTGNSDVGSMPMVP